jgi:ADP-ribose pyrophosphatase
MRGRVHLQGEETIHQGYVLRLVQASFTSPDGEPFDRDIVRAPGAVAVVAVVDDGPGGPEAVLVRQYRPALDSWLVEIPAGLRDKKGEAPADTAARELAEEAGLAAARYELLTVFVNAAGMSDQRTHIYLASGLTDVPSAADGVEERYLTVERVALAEVPTLVSSGVLVDAKTVIGLLLACRRFGI